MNRLGQESKAGGMCFKVFVLFFALFAATTSGHIYTIDSALNYMVTKSMGRHGTLQIPRFMMTVEGEDAAHYSKLGIGQSVAGLPFFWLGRLVEKVSPENPAFTAYSRRVRVPHAGDAIVAEPQTLIRLSGTEGAPLFFVTLTNTLVAAGVCLTFWLILLRLGASRLAALAGSVALGFTTPLWIYARDFFGEPLFALCLLVAFYILAAAPAVLSHRHLALAGLVSSLGILTRASFIPLVVIFAAYLSLRAGHKSGGVKRALIYLGLCLPGIVLLAALNQARFGSIFLSGYHTAFDKGFSVPLHKGIVWNLVSPYRSLFLYAPAVLLGFLGLKAFARKHRGELLLMVAIVVYVFVVYSSWWAWHGGWCWGPRFLVPVIPLLLIPAFAGPQRISKLWVVLAAGLGAAGFVVQLGAILINYTSAYDYWIKIGVLDWAEKNIQMFSPITVHWKAALATSPADYDLWLIQLAQVNTPAAIVLVCGLAGITGILGRMVWRGR